MMRSRYEYNLWKSNFSNYGQLTTNLNRCINKLKSIKNYQK